MKLNNCITLLQIECLLSNVSPNSLEIDSRAQPVSFEKDCVDVPVISGLKNILSLSIPLVSILTFTRLISIRLGFL